MALPADNLFLRLHKWAARQDENFLTESLAVVLEHLLVLAPAVGVRLVERLTGGFIAQPPEDAPAIEIRTQVDTGAGRPDLEIRTPHKLAWIEVKAESELRAGQLEGYRVLLRETGAAQTRLVLLTRYPEAFKPGETRPDLEVRWFEFADWLEEALSEVEATSAVAGFLTTQLLEFLEARGMTLAHVGKTMPEGTRDLGCLIRMLHALAAEFGASPRVSADLKSIGLDLNTFQDRVAIEFADPTKLWFGTKRNLDPQRLALQINSIHYSWETDPGDYPWWVGVELDSEEVYFFARSKDRQLEWLRGFLQASLTHAAPADISNQPPIPEVSDP